MDCEHKVETWVENDLETKLKTYGQTLRIPFLYVRKWEW